MGVAPAEPTSYPRVETMAPSLANLPIETLSLILSHFCLHCTKAHGYDSPDGYFRSFESGEQQHPDQPSWYSRGSRMTLHSMCLVSRRFRSVAQSVLYHEFVPGYGDAWRSTRFSWDGRLASFVRTLVARPDLAALVKRVYVHVYLLRPVKDEEADATLEAAAPAAVDDYLACFQGMQSLVNIAGLKLVGAVLALLPNLERLSLQTEGPSAYIPARALSELGSLSKSGPLANLNTLDICDRGVGCSLDYHAKGILEVTARTGNLTTLNLHTCVGPGRGSLRNIRTLRVTHTRLSAANLGALLSSCAAPGLKSFVYEATHPPANRISECLGFRKFEQESPRYTYLCYFYDRIPAANIQLEKADDRDHFQPSDAIQHLKRHQATLESLHLDLRARGYAPYTDGGDAHPLSETLKAFTVLKHVFLSASMLSNFRGRASYTNYDSVLLTKLLPPSVTSLCLAGDLGKFTPRLGHALRYLAKSVGPRKQFKALQRVRCDAVQATRGLEEMAVREAFAACGVDFGYSTWPLSEPARRMGEETPREALSPTEQPDLPLSDDDDDL